MFDSIYFSRLWLPFLAGYAVIWIAMAVVNRKRGGRIEDPELHRSKESRYINLLGFVPTLLLFGFSIFIPLTVHIGILIPGLILYIAGVVVLLTALFSFSEGESGLNRKGLYRYSRNPMYVGAFSFFTGLVLLGWNSSAFWYAFLVSFVIWGICTHQVVIMEERFLKRKYGANYDAFCNQVRRYV